jgi:hypothetical protein
MRGSILAFNGLVRTSLVRNGADYKHSKRAHTFQPVYTEMLLQICRDYPSLPDIRELKTSEIRFFYNGIRIELKEHTKGK